MNIGDVVLFEWYLNPSGIMDTAAERSVSFIVQVTVTYLQHDGRRRLERRRLQVESEEIPDVGDEYELVYKKV